MSIFEPPRHREQLAATPVMGQVASIEDDELFVTIDAFDSGRSTWGPCRFAPGGALPEIGDECLVIFDEQEAPWVLTLAPVAGGGGDGSGQIDGGRPDSIYGGTTPIDGGGI